MYNFCEDRVPPLKRKDYCNGEKERHLTEGAVIVAFGLYLVGEGATAVEMHPDGEHLKSFNIRACLERHGFSLAKRAGKTNSGGTYVRNSQQLEVSFSPGLGDVVGCLKGKKVLAECKGGIINTRHSGQLSRLRKGLCEAVGQLVFRIRDAQRHIAVLPRCEYTLYLAKYWAEPARSVEIELVLVDERGKVSFVPLPEVHS